MANMKAEPSGWMIDAATYERLDDDYKTGEGNRKTTPIMN
jgi:hypothetical protein